MRLLCLFAQTKVHCRDIPRERSCAESRSLEAALKPQVDSKLKVLNRAKMRQNLQAIKTYYDINDDDETSNHEHIDDDDVPFWQGPKLLHGVAMGGPKPSTAQPRRNMRRKREV
jgi:hypothetical protein